MKSGSHRYVLIACLFWVLAFGSIPTLLSMQTPPAGWDLHVYANAIRSLLAGHDPYLDGIAVQIERHQEMLLHPDVMPPYTYVYSPLTLPLLQQIARLPLRTSGIVYWALNIAGMLGMVWAGKQAAEPGEKNAFTLLAPAALFFPGLLQTNVFFSGNLAYILYGLVLCTAVLGWRRGHWTLFFLATLFASCCKAPLLTLLLIPALSARKQWLPACLSAVAGLALFGLQPFLWPSRMHNYLEAVSLQFSFNHDFGFSLAGLLGSILFALGRPYSFAGTAFYLLYAAGVFGILVYLARRYFAGRISLEAWIPVMLLGVILLNPRIKEYDVAPLTLPMAFILWRVLRRRATFRAAALRMAVFFALINVVAIYSVTIWRPIEGCLLVALFLAGAWQLAANPADPDHPQDSDGRSQSRGPGLKHPESSRARRKPEPQRKPEVVGA